MEGGPIGLDGDTVRDPVDPGYRPERERAPTRHPAMEGQNAQDLLSNIRTAYCKGVAQVSDVRYRLGIFCIGVYRRCLRLLLIWKEKGGTPRFLKRRVSTSPGENLRDYIRELFKAKVNLEKRETTTNDFQLFAFPLATFLVELWLTFKCLPICFLHSRLLLLLADLGK